jgi:EmrB/QacA subfamily drug resistance transporter
VATLLREPARPPLVRDHPQAPWFAVGAVCFGAFMGQLDASIVTLAFPELQRQFGVSLAGVQWVSLSYLLVLTGLLVPAGRMSDRVGRKACYLIGFLVFAAASAACGLAPSLPALVGLRVLQAGGAALLQANSVALVATSVPARMRRAALGVQAAAQAVGLALGPVIGGLLVVSAGWRSIFFVNVPVGLIAVVAGWYLLPRSRALVRGRGADVAGALLLATAAGVSLAALSLLSGTVIRPWAVLGCAAVAMLAAVGLVVRERHATEPLVDLRMLAATGLRPALTGAMCAYLVLFGLLVLIPQVLSARGASALHAGLLLAALPAGFGLAAAGGERLLPRRWSGRQRCAAGGVLAAVSVAALGLPVGDGVLAALLGLTGVGLGCYIPANNAEVMTAAPAAEAATAGGMVNMTRGVGTALGVALTTLALHAGAPPLRAGELLASGALAVAAIVATWTGAHPARRRGGAVGHEA